MISLDECIGMSGLTEEEVEIVAEHEHLTMIVAAELGYVLLQSPKGVFTLRSYIVDVLEHAKIAGNRAKEKRVDQLLTRFNAAHPLPRVLSGSPAPRKRRKHGSTGSAGPSSRIARGPATA